MTVSVIIPNYNHATFLKTRIESVLNQTYTNFEVIILDDCSTDNSSQVIETFRNQSKISHIVYNTVNSGSTFNQWNKGVALAKGELIWIAESDDFCEDDLLKVLTDPFFQDEKIALSFCQSYKATGDGKVTGTWKDWTSNFDSTFFDENQFAEGYNFINKFLIYKNVIPNASAVIFKKHIYQELGGALGNIKNCSDWLMWLKVVSNHRIFYSFQCLNYFRYHEESVSKKVKKQQSRAYLSYMDLLVRIHYQQFLKSKSQQASKETSRLNKQLIKQDRSRIAIHHFNYGELKKGWLRLMHNTLLLIPGNSVYKVAVKETAIFFLMSLGFFKKKQL